MRGQFWCKFWFGSPQNLWVMRMYGLWRCMGYGLWGKFSGIVSIPTYSSEVPDEHHRFTPVCTEPFIRDLAVDLASAFHSLYLQVEDVVQELLAKLEASNSPEGKLCQCLSLEASNIVLEDTPSYRESPSWVTMIIIMNTLRLEGSCSMMHMLDLADNMGTFLLYWLNYLTNMNIWLIQSSLLVTSTRRFACTKIG